MEKYTVGWSTDYTDRNVSSGKMTVDTAEKKHKFPKLYCTVLHVEKEKIIKNAMFSKFFTPSTIIHPNSRGFHKIVQPHFAPSWSIVTLPRSLSILPTLFVINSFGHQFENLILRRLSQKCGRVEIPEIVIFTLPTQTAFHFVRRKHRRIRS